MSSEPLSTRVNTAFQNLAYRVKNILPDQSDSNGKYLTTNGSSISWSDVPLSVMVQENVTPTNGTATIDVEPGKAYRLATTVNNIVINSLPGLTNYQESAIYFHSGDTSPAITFKSGVAHRIIGELTLEADKYYILSIMGISCVLAEEVIAS